MIYIKALSTYHSLKRIDTKQTLKELTGKIFRRSDRFTQLALMGAHVVADSQKLDDKCALYLTSAQANLAVFNRIRDQKYLHNQLPRPVDFINMLSGSASFYVAKHLGLKGKNISLSHSGFAAQMSLIVASSELRSGNSTQVLFGGVDELVEPLSLHQKIAGVEPSVSLAEGSNFLLLSQDAQDALGAIELSYKQHSSSEVIAVIKEHKDLDCISFSARISQSQRDNMLAGHEVFEVESGYYETAVLFVVAEFLRSQDSGDKMLFVDRYNDRYMSTLIHKMPKGRGSE